jgi:hypothetical protein
MGSGSLQQKAAMISNPIVENTGNSTNKNLKTDYTQTPLMGSQVFTKD